MHSLLGVLSVVNELNSFVCVRAYIIMLAQTSEHHAWYLCATQQQARDRERMDIQQQKNENSECISRECVHYMIG